MTGSPRSARWSGRAGATRLAPASLTQGAGFAGVNGIFRFTPEGTNERGLAVRDQQVEVISPAPTTFGGAGL